MAELAKLIVLFFGVLIAVLSLWGVLQPRKLINMVSDAMEQGWGIMLAVGVRLLMGAAMILAAPVSQFPKTFTIIGWIAIVAAVVLVIVGRDLIRKLIAWFSALSDTLVRLWVLFGIAFGAFLIYAVR